MKDVDVEHGRAEVGGRSVSSKRVRTSQGFVTIRIIIIMIIIIIIIIIILMIIIISSISSSSSIIIIVIIIVINFAGLPGLRHDPPSWGGPP